MAESFEHIVARLDRIVRGENGYLEGLADKVPRMERAVKDLRECIDELEGITGRVPELERSVTTLTRTLEDLERVESARIKREEGQKETNRRLRWSFVVPLILMVLQQVVNLVIFYLLLTVGIHL